MKNHPYRYLFYAGIVNGVGDRFSQVAVLTLLLQLTGSGMAVGAALGLRVLPYLLLSPFAGRLADRWSKKRLLILTDLCRLPFALSFLFVRSEADVWILFVGMVVLASGEAFYQPVRKSMIAQIVEKKDILEVNGREQALLGIVLIGGSITGGIVSYLFGGSLAFLLNAASFLGAALFLLPLKDKRKVSVTKASSPKFRWKGGIGFAVAFLLIGAAMDGVFNLMITVYGERLFSLGELGVGLLYGSLGAGMMISFYVTRRLKGEHLLTYAFLLLFMEGAGQSAASQMTSFPLLAAAFFFVSFIGGAAGAVVDSYIMKSTPAGEEGRVFGRIESWTNVQIGLVMFISGVLIDHFHERLVGFSGGLIGMIGAVVLYLLFQYKKKSAGEAGNGKGISEITG